VETILKNKEENITQLIICINQGKDFFKNGYQLLIDSAF
jgi:hypothetical protein